MNNNKKPTAPKLIRENKYFKIGIRDSARVRIIKQGMNHLFDVRNHEMEDDFYYEALRYTEEVIATTRRFHHTEEEDNEIMNMIFGGMGTIEEAPTEEEVAEEAIDGEEEERLEREAEDETLSSEEVWELNERIQAEDQEEYERIRAELDEEEAEANKDN